MVLGSFRPFISLPIPRTPGIENPLQGNQSATSPKVSGTFSVSLLSGSVHMLLEIIDKFSELLQEIAAHVPRVGEMDIKVNVALR